MSLQHHIFLISGRKGTGKDEVCKYIAKKYSNQRYEIHVLRFADKLKDCISILFGWDRIKLDGLTKEDREWRETRDEYWSERLGRDITPRKVLQEFGTEIVREKFGIHFWVYSLHQQILSLIHESLRSSDSAGNASESKKKLVFIIPDTRFWNEYEKTINCFSSICAIEVFYVKSFRNPQPKMDTIQKILLPYQKITDENYKEIASKIAPEMDEHQSEWESTLIELKHFTKIKIVKNDVTSIDDLHNLLDTLH